MKYPNLVPKSMCKTDISVIIYKEGVSETGAPLIALNDKLKCNYQDRA